MLARTRWSLVTGHDVTDQKWTIIDDDGDDYDDVDGDDGGGNNKVVDLWGSSSSSYTADTLTNVFSR